MLGTRNVVVFVPTTDYDKARSFYEGILGLGYLTSDGHAMVLDANGIKVRVVKVPSHQPLPYTILGWGVPDIESAVTELAQRGVTFERFGFFQQDPLGIWTAP